MDPPITEITNLLEKKETSISFGQGIPFFYPDSELLTEFWRDIKNDIKKNFEVIAFFCKKFAQ